MMRPIHLRLPALCLPLFFGGEHFVPFDTKARMRMYRENDIARTIRPREAGKGPLELAKRVNRGGGAPSLVVGAGGLQRWSCFVLRESKRASLMSAPDDNLLAASRPAPHLGAAEAEDAGGVGIVPG